MKSSATARILCPTATSLPSHRLAEIGLGHVCPPGGSLGLRTPPEALERDPGEDQHAAGDLQRMQRLREQHEREEHREERLQVPEERRARRRSEERRVGKEW